MRWRRASLACDVSFGSGRNIRLISDAARSSSQSGEIVASSPNVEWIRSAASRPTPVRAEPVEPDAAADEQVMRHGDDEVLRRLGARDRVGLRDVVDQTVAGSQRDALTVLLV